MSDITIPLRNIDEERILLGHLDRNLRNLRSRFGIDATSRGGKLTLSGDPSRLDDAAKCIETALRSIREEGADAARIAEMLQEPLAVGGEAGGLHYAAKPQSKNQQRYMEAIESHDVTFGIGPAGTGKTYLAVAMAVSFLKADRYRRMILVRPAVEAGERLGFLPGDLEAKVDPYVRPLYDALGDLLPKGVMRRYVDEGVIEICPLAYMRGRTLNDSVIILDEAQNTTTAQMKMFLTRMGRNSKIIVTGDVTQIDLPGERESGLVQAVRILRRVEGLAFCHLTNEDIVRHPVVQGIVKAYNSWDERVRQGRAADPDRNDRRSGATEGRSRGNDRRGGGGSDRRSRQHRHR